MTTSIHDRYAQLADDAQRREDRALWRALERDARAAGEVRIAEAAEHEVDRIDGERLGQIDLATRSPLGAQKAYVHKAETYDEAGTPRGTVLIKSAFGEWGVGESHCWPNSDGIRIEDAYWHETQADARANYAELITPAPSKVAAS